MTENETEPAQPGTAEQNVSAASVVDKPQETETAWQKVQRYFKEEHNIELRGMMGFFVAQREGKPVDGYFFLGRTSVNEVQCALLDRMMGSSEPVDKDE
jgi:hypothetical protein